MKKLVLALLAITGIAVLFVSCGDTKKTTPIASQSFSLAFLEQKPNSTLFYPVLANLKGSQFTTVKVEDPSTAQPVSGAIGSIMLNAAHDKAVLEVYGGTNEAAPTNQWDIFIGTLNGVQLTQITNDANTDEVPQFNPAGTKVIFSSIRNDSWVTVIRNTDGTGEQVLPQPFGAETWHPTFSPDGTKIAVEAWGYSEGENYFDGIVLMNADGSNPTQLTNPYGPDCWCFDEEPTFTPDGSQIVFSREDDASSTEDVYIMKTDGSGVTKLTDGLGINFDPLVVRDSTTNTARIVFSSNRNNLNAASAGFELYTMNTDGSGLSQLTYNTVYDGFNLELFEESGSPNIVRARQQRHQPRPMVAPAQRLRW